MLVFCLLAVAQSAPLAAAERAFEEGRLFELAGHVQDLKDRSGKSEFLRGYVLAGQNRSREALVHFKQAARMTTGTWRRRTLENRSTTYARLGMYRAAAESLRELLKPKQFSLSEKERKSSENTLKVFEGLKDVAPMKVRKPSDVSLYVPKSPGFKIPFRSKGASLVLTADTGADFSLVRESLAKKLKLRMIPNPIELGSITGDKSKATFGVADELHFGSASVSNVVFLVMKDKDLYFPQIKFQLDGVIGLPVLLHLGDITFFRNGKVFIRKGADHSGKSNLFLSGFKPFIQGAYQGVQFTCAFDSGANKSMLYLPFYHRFRKEIDERGFPSTSRIAGVAGVRTTPIMAMSDLDLHFAGRKVTWPSIDVLTTVRDEAGKKYFGNIGQDLMLQFRSARFNWARMRLVLED